MKKSVKKLALLVGAIVAVDLIIPSVGADEIALQAGLVAVFGGVMLSVNKLG